MTDACRGPLGNLLLRHLGASDSFFSMSSSTDTSEGLLQQVESFVSDNRKVIIAGAAFVVAAGGAGYYLYALRNATKPAHDLEKAPEGRKKKKNKKKKVGDNDGPVLEERKSKLSDTASDAASGKDRLLRTCFDTLTDSFCSRKETEDLPKLTKAEIEALPEAVCEISLEYVRHVE